MFAQAESEELLHLLSQVRLVADEEERREQEQHQLDQLIQQHLNTGGENSIPEYIPSSEALGKEVNSGCFASRTGGGGGSALARYTASSTAAITSSWTVHDNTENTFGISIAAPSGSCLTDDEHHPHTRAMGQPPLNQTPSTDVKLLQPPWNGGKEDDTKIRNISALPHAKQLHFASPSAAPQSTVAVSQQTPSPDARQSLTPTHTPPPLYTAACGTVGPIAPHSTNSTAQTLPTAVTYDGGENTTGAVEGATLNHLCSAKVTSSAPTSYARKDNTPLSEGRLNGSARVAPVARWEGGGGRHEDNIDLVGGVADRLSDSWTPARDVGTPHSALDGPLHSIGPLHLQQRQTHQILHPRHTSPSSPASVTEAAVAQFIRGGSGCDAPHNAGQGSARRLSVEAELTELQRGVCPSVAGPGGARVHGTPILMVSPLPPASTTPYHQLLSQLRQQSPSQIPASGIGSAHAPFVGSAAHANTPPDRHPLPYPSHRTVSGPTALYTANITSIQRPPSAAAADSSSATAPAVAALLRTPDTIPKSVTLSSIAAHLHDGVGNRCSPDETYGAQPQTDDCRRVYASPPASTAALERVFRPTRAAQLCSPQSPLQTSPPLSVTVKTEASPTEAWHQGRSHHRPEQHVHTEPPSTSITPARVLPPPPASHKCHQTHAPTVSMRRWSPVDAPPITNGASPATGNVYKTTSPPSCSLRPSPHPRPSNGSSPALRRYTIITTPTSPATAVTAANNASSIGKHSLGRSPHSASGTSAAVRGTSREARPRIQIWHSTHTTSGAARSARGSLNTSTHRAGNSSSPSSSQHHTNPASQVGRQLNNSSNPAVATVGTGTSMVTAAAVHALTQRLQTAAALMFRDSLPVASAASGGGLLSPKTEEGVFSAVTAVPDVVSAPIILAMSHDQQGCRLLQAVIDAECNGGKVLDEKHDELTAVDNAGPVSSSITGACLGETREEIDTTMSEHRRRLRADAFESSVAVRVVLLAIEPKLDAVMADGYGNFLLQKIFDMAPDAERQRLLRLPSLQHHLCEVACSPHGTFAVQRLVETVRNTEEERLVFVALERDLLRLLTNANGGHVLMKVMECLRRQYTALAFGAGNMSDPSSVSTATSADAVAISSDEGDAAASSRRLLEDRVDAIYQAVQQHLLYVCQHKQGCCIVQKCLDFLHACAGLSPAPSSATVSHMDYFESMAALLLPHVQELSTHPFGNYVVTRLVDVCYARGSTATIDAVAAVMQQDLLRMCTNKFASNVIEHILRHCSERRIRLLCHSLMMADPACSTSPTPNSSGPTVATIGAAGATIAQLPLTTVVMDPYGNYVVQTLLTVAPVDELMNTSAEGGGMLPVLQQLLPLLSSRNYGRKLETKTELALLRVEQSQQQPQRKSR